jgi:hypothetical protein
VADATSDGDGQERDAGAPGRITPWKLLFSVCFFTRSHLFLSLYDVSFFKKKNKKKKTNR